ncbi:uncharacterized protein LOC132755504, partial [Ruditapes philippinarum]|uniref:uncharacterized protein LOC132755504 n=1 Tax=Ruditapes philippinarum TaxID=129788 RepID=UPI00295C040F
MLTIFFVRASSCLTTGINTGTCSNIFTILLGQTTLEEIMQLQVFIPLCMVFLCVVDSRSTDFQRRRFPPGSREVTTEEPTPTETYPSSPDEVPDVDIPEIDYENWPYAMMECKLQQKLISSFFSNNQNIKIFFSSFWLVKCVTARLVTGRSPNKT